MCISRAILKCCLIDISDLDYFSKYLRQSLTGCSKRSLESVIDIGGEEHIVPLDSFFVGKSWYLRTMIYASKY